MIRRVWATPQAEAQARVADAWWREHREASPDLFYQEFVGAVDMLTVAPEIGRLYPEGGVLGLRRLLLPGSRYHVYYVHDSENDEVAILAVWSAVRGRGPKLG